mmetsp:Transcript_2650/g.7596  ORF Transcript_2650/g.7596 Transcript_2650/m.7596 type:complete len:201 (-) Transcript_2650:93-695(-)
MLGGTVALAAPLVDAREFLIRHRESEASELVNEAGDDDASALRLLAQGADARVRPGAAARKNLLEDARVLTATPEEEVAFADARVVFVLAPRFEIQAEEGVQLLAAVLDTVARLPGALRGSTVILEVALPLHLKLESTAFLLIDSRVEDVTVVPRWIQGRRRKMLAETGQKARLSTCDPQTRNTQTLVKLGHPQPRAWAS